MKIVALALTAALTTGYPVTEQEYDRVHHGQSLFHIEQQFDNTGNVVRRWNSPRGVHHRVKFYVGTDGNWPEPTEVYVYIWYRKTAGWREYKKQCEPAFDTSTWVCESPQQRATPAGHE